MRATESGERGREEEGEREDPSDGLDSDSQRPQDDVRASESRQERSNPKEHNARDDEADPPRKVDQVVEKSFLSSRHGAHLSEVRRLRQSRSSYFRSRIEELVRGAKCFVPRAAVRSQLVDRGIRLVASVRRRITRWLTGYRLKSRKPAARARPAFTSSRLHS